ncbi:MAG TPA: site-2 protease family protein [Candidatus Acidoferrales bacterium]|nr:site-2 protease family protein [Candidatus Acidoferrales bacterium]
MFRHTIPLGRILGIPIGLDYSWFLIFGLLTWSLATGYYPAEFRDWPAAQYWITAGVTAALMFSCVLLHELGHSVVALRFKVPVRSITLFIFGGVAQLAAEPPSASAEFQIAIAGPIVSFVLAALFAALQMAFAGAESLFALAKYLAFINAMLASFNLIPGFPLDGGRVFRAIVWGFTKNFRRATLIAATVGRFIAFLFIAFGVWQVFSGHVANGVWIIFIGWFLDTAAVAQTQQQMLQGFLAGHKVSEAMSRDYLSIPGPATLQELVDSHVLGEGRRTFMVGGDGQGGGLLTLHSIKSVPKAEWPTTTAAQAMIPMERLKSIQPDAEVWTALELMDRDGVNQLPVISGGTVVGLLSRDSVITYLRTLQEIAK